MLTENEKGILRSIMSGLSKDEMVKELMSMYASESIDNARELLRYSDKLVDIMLKRMEENNLLFQSAAYMLLCQRVMNEDDDNTMFASMVPVCMTLFPNGVKEDQSSKAGEEYFEKFLKILAKGKAFRFNDKNDAAWAKCYGYEDYLNMVIDKNMKI